MQTLIDLLTDQLRDKIFLQKQLSQESDLDWEKNIIFACSPSQAANILKSAPLAYLKPYNQLRICP